VKKLFNMSGITYEISTDSRGVFSVGKIVGLSKWVDWMDAAWCGGFAAGQDSDRVNALKAELEASKAREAELNWQVDKFKKQVISAWCNGTPFELGTRGACRINRGRSANRCNVDHCPHWKPEKGATK
jgi:hypothetical protein